jgi:hypothetical protein
VAVTVFSRLDKALHEHLATLVRLSSTADDGTAADLARFELPKVVTALKALLDEHTPDEHGRCPTCRSRWWSRRLPSPCRAYLGVQLCLNSVADDPRPRRARSVV